MIKVIKLGADKMVTGIDALDYFRSQATEIHRALIVMGKGSLVKNGSLDKLQEALAAGNIISDTFMGVEADPTFDTVMEGVKKANEFQPDAIIGFGGGSAMDAAKAIWVFYENPERTTLESVLLPNLIPNLGIKAKLICIPTTAGTGSEVTRVAVITDTQKHVKHAIVDLKLRTIPSLNLLCPEFTLSMPPYVTAASGMDAITHAVEAYVAGSAGPFSDAMAYKAFKDAYDYLPLAVENGDNLTYRDRMLSASCMAGIAFSNASLGIAHSMAHALGGQYQIAHGAACALVLPYVIKWNEQNENAKEKYKELAQVAGYESLSEAIHKLCEKIGIPTTVNSYFESRDSYEKAIPQLADIAYKDICTPANPVAVDTEALSELFRKMYQ